MMIELTRASLTYVVFRRQRVIWTVAGACLALAVLYCIVATSRFQADSGLVVSFSPMPSGVPGQTTQGAEQPPAPLDHEEIVASYTLELQSSDLARRVISEVGVEKVYPPYSGLNPLPYVMAGLSSLLDSNSDPAAGRERELEVAVDRFLKKDLKVESERNSNVITLSVLNENRSIAVQVAQRLIDTFIEREARIDRDPRLEFIRGQVEVYRKHVTDAQAAMESFRVKNGISSMEEERTTLIQERSNLEQSIIATHSRAVGDEQSVRSFAAQMEQLSPVIATAQNDKDPLELSVRTNLADLKTRETALNQAFSADSAAVQDVRRQIRAAEDLLDQVRSRSPLTHAEANTAYQQIQVAMAQAKADLEAARESEASQRQQLGQLNDRMATRDRQESAYQDAVRDYELADQNYRLYLQGVESARIADDLNKQRLSSISVFDRPYASIKPARPKRPLVILVSAFGGLILGLLAAFAAEALDEALSTPSQVESLLKVHVLGSMERR